MFRLDLDVRWNRHRTNLCAQPLVHAGGISQPEGVSALGFERRKYKIALLHREI